MTVSVIVVAACFGGGRAPAEALPSLSLTASSGTLRFVPWVHLSGSLALAITNNDSTNNAFLNSANVGLILIPKTVTTGSLTMSFGAPATNALFTDSPIYLQFPEQTGLAPVTISGTSYTTYDWATVSNSTNYDDLLAPSTTANLGTVTFTVGTEGTATDGEWELWAVNQSDPSPTHWSSAAGGYSATAFSNIAASDGTAVLLTTISVPEPTTWLMAGIGTATAAGASLRRRRKTRPGLPAAPAGHR